MLGDEDRVIRFGVPHANNHDVKCEEINDVRNF